LKLVAEIPLLGAGGEPVDLVRTIVSHVQHAPTSGVTTYYTEQKARLGWPVARIAAARKLTRVIYAMLRTNTPWQERGAQEPQRGELQYGHAASTAS